MKLVTLSPITRKKTFNFVKKWLRSLLFPAMLCLSQNAWAQSDSENATENEPNQGQRKTFKDWAMRCEGEEGSENHKCYIYQTLLLKETNERLLKVAVGYSPYQTPPLLLMSAPLGMFLPDGITVTVDDLEPRKAVVERCNPEGCHAALAIDEKLLTELKGGRWMSISLLDGNLQTVRMKVSLLGFTAGYNEIPQQKVLQRQ